MPGREATPPYGGSATDPLESTRSVGAEEEEVVQLRVHGGGAHTGVAPPGFEGMHSHVLDACPKARLTDDEKLDREVARRRQAELERRSRIMDVKRRGVDKEVIDQQCRENSERKKQEAQAEKAANRQFMGMGINRQMQAAEAEKVALRRQQEVATKAFSMQNLSAATRREADLNDPPRKGVPARIGDDDPRCGPASMQQFKGEDLLKEDRKRQQQMEMRDAIEHQIFEKKMMHIYDTEEDKASADIANLTQMRNEIEAEQDAHRKGCMSEYREHLLSEINVNRERMGLEKQLNQQLDDQELNFHANDPLLNEQGGIRASGKPDKAGYRGSTREQRGEVQQAQRDQCEEVAQRKFVEGHADKQHNNSTEMTRRELLLLEREKQRAKRAMAMEVAQHNQGMLAVQKTVSKDAHKNAISPEFHDQFGRGGDF